MNAKIEKLDLQEQEELTFGSRRPRKRHILIAAIVLLAVVALIIGLAVGLTRSRDSDDDGLKSGKILNNKQYQPLVVVSLDGFRASYISYNVTPNIQGLIAQGVHTLRMLSVYPTLTFPNHYTIVTGLYPESHGIVDNQMFDVSFMRQYSLGSPEAAKPRWYGGEPIWLTAQRQGKRSACYFWVGSDVPIGGQYPDEYRKYNTSVPYSDRVDTVLGWLSQPPESRPDLIMLYFDEPDTMGHSKGPGPSKEMLQTLRKVDDQIGRLITGLQEQGLYSDVNLVLVADHGMSERACDQQVVLKNYFSESEIRNIYVYNGAAGRINNRYKYSSRNYTVLDTPIVSAEKILQKMPRQFHIAVYEKSQLPKRLHYANNIRIDDFILKMEDHWVVSRYGSTGSSCSGGTHGWDSRYDSMAALFVAHGPAFRVGVEVPPFENIELYNMFADLLNITAAPNNGTQGSLYHLLKQPPSHKSLTVEPPQCQIAVEIPQTSCCNSSSEQDHILLFRPRTIDIPEPVSSSYKSQLCLSSTEHVTMYSTQLHMPLWTSFVITDKEGTLQNSGVCFVPDNNLPEEEKMVSRTYNNESLGIVATALFSTSSSCGKITLSSNALPMMKSLEEDLWQEMWAMVGRMINTSFPAISVTMGPVFDYDYNGLADNVDNITRFVDSSGQIPLPSHYFVVLAGCPQTGQQISSCAKDLDVLSFILPNQQNQNGQNAEIRLLENVARVRDIELLTGLLFFTDIDPAQSVQLRTHVPVALWTKPGVWSDNLCPIQGPSQCTKSYQPLVLISLDGFRADYLVKYNRTPTINKLINCGVHAPYMRSVYPTVTFPNHYSIVTGLYPESHGIVANNMYDLDMKQRFCLSCQEAKNPAWWGGEPIWLTAKRQGHRTATFFWPGSEVAIQGEHPDYYFNYSGSVAYAERVETVLNWLKLPEDKRPDFITLYFDEPDHTGHQVGPDSPQIGEKLAEVDMYIGKLMQGLYQQDMHHCANIIVIADHGMSGLSCERMVVLSADISSDDLSNMYVYDGPFGRISNKYASASSHYYPLEPPKMNISTIVDKLECSDAHMRVYTKSSLPLRHHYTNNKRIDDVLLDADDQWIISRTGATSACKGGNHGYDNLYASMHALFVAYGPAFKSGLEIEPFENIELYNFMTGLLGISPAPNNGTEGMLFDVLRFPPSQQSQPVKPAAPCSTETDLLTSSSEQQKICHCSRIAVQSASNWSYSLGEPVATPDGPSFCVTHQSNYALAYSHELLAPAWISFTVNNKTSTNTLNSTAYCVVRDSWMSPAQVILNSTFLENTGFVPGSLLFDSGDPCNLTMASEVVPMFADFHSGIWEDVKKMVADYSSKYGQIAVSVGPVYNDDASALWQGRTNKTRLLKDMYPVPTHFFLLLGKCEAEEQSLPCWDTLELMSFIIPHVPVPSNCQSFSDMLRENVARVRDIEIATGLRFFPHLNISYSARLRTFLPTQLWNGSSEAVEQPKPGHWIEQECPPREHADGHCPNEYQPVLLVSLDGFKPQYLGRGLTPVIDRLVNCGVHAPFMRSVYPTLTFPNHYSIATGLYPESHGIVDNNMFDFNISNSKFTISSTIKNDPRWWGGEPIWITSQKQNHSSASYFWVGSEVKIMGSYPDLVKYYAEAVPYSTRVSTVVKWMKLPENKRPDLLMLYFDEPDHQAHITGPFAPEVDEQVQRVDSVIGQLMDQLYQHDLHHCVNLLLVSDHGFSPISCDEVIELNNYFTTKQKNELYFYFGAFAHISNTYRRQGSNSTVPYTGVPPMSIRDVQQHLRCVEHMNVYAKTDLPKRFHYTKNHRIDNIILDPAINWTVSDQISAKYCTGGTHGWDNMNKAMESLFVGYGPAFRNGETVSAFENIELYNLISDLLNIQPAANNGTEGSLDHLLWRTFNRSQQAAAQYSNMFMKINGSSLEFCNCTADHAQLLDSISQALNSQDTSMVKQSSLPFGVPLLMTSSKGNVTLLYQSTHVTAYWTNISLPLWTSTSVSASQRKENFSSSSCTVMDTHVDDVRHCENHQRLAENITQVSLLPLVYELGETSFLFSSFIPMYEAFYTGVWQILQHYLGEWSANYKELNIISGPIFDVNNDGLADTLDEINKLNRSVPTHVFLIVSRCENNSIPLTKCQNIQTLSFILPQVDSSKEFNCQTTWDYLVDNEARVRDIELLTDLQFFPDLRFTQAVAMRTYLPSGLWVMQ